MSRLQGLSRLASLALSLAGGCSVEPFCLDCVDGSVDGGGMDANVGDSGRRDAGPAGDAGPGFDGCMEGAEEICNLLDDDCDGEIDEGIDTATDLRNCGGCGIACAPAHAFGACVDSACEVLECDIGFFDRNADPTDGCEVHCIATEPEETLCDLRDNDCDGMVDETFDLMTDPMNCGRCGRACRFAHATAACSAGNCVISACDPGYSDVDGIPITGCEYSCTATGPETCNLRDDDCDGMVDDGDPGGGATCGSSVGICTTGIMHCVGGAPSCVGATGPAPAETCNGMDDDCDGVTDEDNPGGGGLCGSSMGVCRQGTMRCMGGTLSCMGGTGPGTETCNGLDDDCDGTIDEGNPDGGAPCGLTMGECRAGTLTCGGGGLSCIGGRGPALEVCNGLDDDCDGVTDNGYDTAIDPRNCGMCGRACSYAHASALCAMGTCMMGSCAPGWVNRNGSAIDGCEYACDYTGAEVCNGRDDDCDGMIDEGLTPPSTFCLANGVCSGTTPTCGGMGGWQCMYPPLTYQTTETRCDGLDNDCDGDPDEPFPSAGLACDNGALGTCRRTGTFLCNMAGTGVVCDAAAPPLPGVEACNNLDDDCNGVIDNDPPAAWVPFTLSGGAARWVFQYEASRPDSTSSSAGTRSHHVCSEPNRLPWANVSPAEAATACATIGARLCTEAEWQRACETSAGTACTWSYASACRTYAADTCNGFDHDVDGSMGGIQNGVLATAAMPMCYANWGGGATQRAFDMTGNLQEFTSPRSAGVNPMRGGSYNDLGGGSTCQFSFEVAPNTFRAPNVGFRCCRSTAPP